MQRHIALVLVFSVALSQAIPRYYVATDTVGHFRQRTADPCAQDNLWHSFAPTDEIAAQPFETLETRQICTGTPQGWPQSAVTLSGPSPLTDAASGQFAGAYAIVIDGEDLRGLTSGIFVNPNDNFPIGFACLSSPGAEICPDSCDPLFTQYSSILRVNLGTGNRMQLIIDAVGGWLTTQIQLEIERRALCFQLIPGSVPPLGYHGLTHALTAPFYSGFMWEVERGCTIDAHCLTLIAPDLDDQTLRNIRSQTTCCGNRCYRPTTHLCCSNTVSTRIEKTEEKCCNPARGFTMYLDQACPCVLERAVDATPVCPIEEHECCLPTKFTELVPTAAECATADTVAARQSSLCGRQYGQCYSPLNHKCCNTGHRYDPGVDQCCSINGLQSANVPCPCQVDSDCWGGSTRTYTGLEEERVAQRCCRQTAPDVDLAQLPAERNRCSRYSNYPSGTVENEFVRCTGQCIDPRYLICCNGVACRREYEKCCNDTCCNRFVGTCSFGFRNGAPDRLNNARDFSVLFEQCTTVEKLDEIRVFWIFVLPTALLLATLLGLALVLVFANKASVRIFSFIEKTIMGLAIFIVLFASLLYFSPAYKYGVFVVFVALVAIAAAAARVKWLNALALIFIAIAILYIINPFDGNNYLTFGYLRDEVTGNPRYDTHGLFHLLTRLYPRFEHEERDNICTEWYQGYFRLDPELQDFGRVNNREVTTFAYCSRGFIVGLLITAAVMLIFLAALFILVLFGLLLRFRKNRLEPIELEIRPEPLLAVPVY